MRQRIKSYEEAAHFLGQAESRRPGQRATTVLRLTPTAIAVRYHQTDVVIYHHPETDKLATIDAGGYVAETTARRINDFAPEGVRAYVWEDELMIDDDVHGVVSYRLSLGAPYVMRRNGRDS